MTDAAAPTVALADATDATLTWAASWPRASRSRRLALLLEERLAPARPP